MLANAMPLQAAAPPSPAAGMMRLLKSGRVPPERLGPILELICSRGNADDLAYVYGEVLKPDAYPQPLRIDVLNRLADAARTRKVVPGGDLTGIAGLLSSDDPRLKLAAVELAGLWHVATAAEALEALALDTDTAPELRAAVLEALGCHGDDVARRTIDKLIDAAQPFAVRSAGIAALARSDLGTAARLAAAALNAAGADDDVAPLLDAFLDRQGGTEALAAALEKSPPGADGAKLLLRQMYSVGRSDAALSEVLERAAGIQGDVKPPTKDELAALMQEVAEQGDPARGEAVFRRADLSCMKCHAVSQAGGQIGPDLSPLGSTSPVDYIINSIYDPDLQIKEAFHTKVVLTSDGLTLQGILADRTDDALVLKDANDNRLSIPLADIEEEIEGKSLMPKGLVKFMTRAELVDLVRFLSQLGKPGEYAIRATPRMQRWRVLLALSPELIADVPNEATFEDQVLLSPNWGPAYARVNGVLPLDDLAARTRQTVLYVQGEVNVSKAGDVGIRCDAPPATHLWVDSESFAEQRELTVHLEPGIHKITLRVTNGDQPGATAKLELFRVSEGSAEFTTVDGQ
jgi:putative heme-binding domain-containing protein